MDVNKNKKMNLEKATQIMYEELGFKPKKSKIIYHEQDSWLKLLDKHGVNEFLAQFTSGMYVFPELEVHVPKKANLIALVHEYLGHGSFYEYSQLGKKKRSHLKEMDKMELDLFKRRIGIGHGMSEKEIDEIISSLLKKSEKNKIFRKKVLKYCNLRNKTTKFMDEINWKSEGFATWMEHYISQKLGLNWPELSVSSQYYAYFTKLRDYEKKYGTKKMLKYVGF